MFYAHHDLLYLKTTLFLQLIIWFCTYDYSKLVLDFSMPLLKGTVSWDFQNLFLLERFYLGPIWTGKNGFANFSILTKIFHRKVQKSRVRVDNNFADTSFFANIFKKNEKFRKTAFACSFGADIQMDCLYSVYCRGRSL